MPVEYNWVGDYEDPAKLKKEIRRGVCLCVGEREWAVVLISLSLVLLNLNHFITLALTNSQFFNFQPLLSVRHLVTYIILTSFCTRISLPAPLGSLFEILGFFGILHFHGNSDIEVCQDAGFSLANTSLSC